MSGTIDVTGVVVAVTAQLSDIRYEAALSWTCECGARRLNRVMWFENAGTLHSERCQCGSMLKWQPPKLSAATGEVAHA